MVTAEANLSGDVSIFNQKIGVDVHAVVELPKNPLGAVRCLRGGHGDDCNVLEHVNVVDFSVTPQFG